MCNIVKDFARSIPSYIKADMTEYVAGDKTTKVGKRIIHKALFKKAYRNRLPDYILNKKKSGWRFPTDEILIGTQDHPGKNDSVLRSYIIESLKDKDIRELFELDDNIINNIFLNNKTYVPQPGSKHPPGLLKQKELFTILNFAVWKKVYKMSI